MEDFSVVGTPAVRVDGLGKVTGETPYLNDIVLPGMLYGAVLRSPHAHARLLSIDTTKAAQLPGVRAVITAQDTPRKKFAFVAEQADREMLCTDKVRFVGDLVAAVAAESLEAALAAVDSIAVQYEPLPAVDSIAEALAPEAPLVHEEKGQNVSWEVHRAFGDVEAGFAQADHLFENDFSTSRVCHCALETRGVVAQWLPSGRLKVWSPTQAPHTLRQELSRILEIPIARVVVERTTVGGGFGQRLVMDMIDPAAALLSRITKRPVKIVNTRSEEFQAARTRYPYRMHLKTGVTRDGKILAQQLTIHANNGAYNDKGAATLNACASIFPALWNVPNTKIDGYLVYTNQQPGTAFRGFGNVQMHFALESQMDILARALRIDPLTIRKINANRVGVVPGCNYHIPSCEMEQCLRVVAEQVNYQEKSKLSGQLVDGKRYGLGIAGVMHTGGGARYYGYNSSQAFVKISEDGLVTVITPAVEIGQGVTTGLAQIAAEVLGIGVDRIVIINDRTDIIGYDLGAYGSRALFVNGLAVKAAAEDARAQVVKIAAQYFEAAPAEIRLRNGQVYVEGRPEGAITWEQLIDHSYRVRGEPLAGKGIYYDDVAPEVKRTGKLDFCMPTYTFAVLAVEVLVDEETGEVQVTDFTSALDCGTVINPAAVSGQMEGAALQGLGYAFTENAVIENGRMLNPSFVDYKTLRTQDLPNIRTFFVESRDPLGPFGAKGVGELGIIPITSACANAVADATGIRFFDLPITPEKIRKALKERRARALEAS